MNPQSISNILKKIFLIALLSDKVFSSFLEPRIIKPRIVNGNIGKIEDFCYIVSIGIKNPDDPVVSAMHFCGGAILDEFWVITAAHCLLDEETGKRRDEDTVVVRAGLQELDESDIADKSYLIETFFTHPNYSSETFLNDVALIKTIDPIKFSAKVCIICIDYRVVYFIRKLTAAGYGDTTEKIENENGETIQNSERGNQLRFANFKEDRFSPDCAKERICVQPADEDSGEEQSNCFGDSGGPLTYKVLNGYEKYIFLVGTSSVQIFEEDKANDTIACGGKSKYTRMSFVRDFIDSIIEYQYCYRQKMKSYSYYSSVFVS